MLDYLLFENTTNRDVKRGISAVFVRNEVSWIMIFCHAQISNVTNHDVFFFRVRNGPKQAYTRYRCKSTRALPHRCCRVYICSSLLPWYTLVSELNLVSVFLLLSSSPTALDISPFSPPIRIQHPAPSAPGFRAYSPSYYCFSIAFIYSRVALRQDCLKVTAMLVGRARSLKS